eukprot:NODE_42_length_29671_cov_0.584810.p9 type:complete len:255 gc:universal NODE_42_length_29671_cov_0.584810:14236-15000(+)
MPQHNYIEQAIKQQGRKFDHLERTRKKEAREPHKVSQMAKTLHGWKAKQFNKKQFTKKINMMKTIKAHEEKTVTKSTNEMLPTYLLDRQLEQGKILTNRLKQKRIEKQGKWDVHIPQVRSMPETEVFKVIQSGKRKKKMWKRMITKPTFVGSNFTRKAPKYERFIRPTGLRYTKAHVTHPELRTTFYLPMLGVKQNPQSHTMTQLGVLTKGTVIEVDVQELGLVTQGGRIVWGKYAQISNNPELDGCVNAVLLV